MRRGRVRRHTVAFMTAVVVAALACGCNYTFQAGAGFPPHVQTLAVEQFDNETDRFDVAQEIYEELIDELPRSFGLNTAGEEFADAIIRGSVQRYSVDAPSYRSGQDGGGTQVIERQVVIGISVQVIDRVNNVILWENSSLSERGVYLEASELEENGRELAIERLVRAIVNGLQSNW